MPQNDQQWVATILSFGLLALVLALRIRRERRMRPLRVERLWVLPAVYAGLVALLFVAHPPVGIVWLYAALALAAGAAAGWYRGTHMAIHVDPQTHAVSQQGSRAAMIVLFLLVLLRYGARGYMENGGDMDPARLMAATDVMLAGALGFVTAQRAEMGLRARALLAQAKDKPA